MALSTIILTFYQLFLVNIVKLLRFFPLLSIYPDGYRPAPIDPDCWSSTVHVSEKHCPYEGGFRKNLPYLSIGNRTPLEERNLVLQNNLLAVSLFACKSFLLSENVSFPKQLL